MYIFGKRRTVKLDCCCSVEPMSVCDLLVWLLTSLDARGVKSNSEIGHFCVPAHRGSFYYILFYFIFSTDLLSVCVTPHPSLSYCCTVHTCVLAWITSSPSHLICVPTYLMAWPGGLGSTKERFPSPLSRAYLPPLICCIFQPTSQPTNQSTIPNSRK